MSRQFDEAMEGRFDLYGKDRLPARKAAERSHAGGASEGRD